MPPTPPRFHRLRVREVVRETAKAVSIAFDVPAAAVDGNVVIVPFSSGEIFALRADNGRVLWADSLAGVVKSDAVSSLADIRGYPVVDRGQVFATSHGGRMVGIDLRSGGRIWDRDVGSLYTPWLAGDFLFVTTVNSEVVCLTRREGRVRWVTQLDQYDDAKRKRGRIVWTGPVVIGDRLFVTNSRGEAVLISPKDGKVTQHLDLPGPVDVPVAVASATGSRPARAGSGRWCRATCGRSRWRST